MDQITVRCKDQRQINLSKSVLCEHSDRIKLMLRFYSNKTSVFLYLPYSSDIFQQIKKYLEERGENITSMQNAMDIFCVSNRLHLRYLNKVCREFMTDPSRLKDVCYVYEFAFQQNDWRLDHLCWNIISSKWQEIFSSDELLNCKATTMDRLVSRPINRFIEEADIFSIVLKWAKKRVNIEKYLRKVMEPFLPYIRFLTMPEWFLESQVFVEPILTDVERDAIRCYLQNEDFNETWFIPDSICAIKCSRKHELLSSWLSYVNRSAYFINKVRRMNTNFRFICEIVVKEDCFINELHLPITHCRKEGIT
ncbi:kelch-like protein 40, partial [Centruroides sculpturatus]|uniref:kelch-like protein 40 n=1 Tax=Centruroides sculpturatus TaxID=218467 RepID=UPI000C6CA395